MNSDRPYCSKLKSATHSATIGNYLLLAILLCLILNIFMCYNDEKSSSNRELHFNVRIIENDLEGSPTSSSWKVIPRQDSSSLHSSSTFAYSRRQTKPQSLYDYLEIVHIMLQEYLKSHGNQHIAQNDARQEEHGSKLLEEGKQEQASDVMNHRIKSRIKRENNLYKVFYGDMQATKNKFIPEYNPEEEDNNENKLRQTEGTEAALGYFLDAIHITDLISEIIRSIINHHLHE